MEKVTYDINDVTGRLSARIANLEVQLAHESAAKDAYAVRVKELEQELEDIDMSEKERGYTENAE